MGNRVVRLFPAIEPLRLLQRLEQASIRARRPYAIGLAVVLGAMPLGIGRALRYILAGT